LTFIRQSMIPDWRNYWADTAESPTEAEAGLDDDAGGVSIDMKYFIM
jgi:hypothetical protein